MCGIKYYKETEWQTVLKGPNQTAPLEEVSSVHSDLSQYLELWYSKILVQKILKKTL